MSLSGSSSKMLSGPKEVQYHGQSQGQRGHLPHVSH